MHSNYTNLLSKEYIQIAIILFTFEYFGHHVNLLCFTWLSVSGRNDLPQSQPTSGTLDPEVKDVIINFQAYCCILQECFPVHPPSRSPIPRKRPATYKYIGLLIVTTFSSTWRNAFNTSLRGEKIMSSTGTVSHRSQSVSALTTSLEPYNHPDEKMEESRKTYVCVYACVCVTGSLRLTEC